jgi:hypothetical protein
MEEHPSLVEWVERELDARVIEGGDPRRNVVNWSRMTVLSNRTC